MEILSFIVSKPVLIGLHLGFAILGIDAFLWLLGEILSDSGSSRRRLIAAALGVVGFLGSWLVGGYYYVKFYGPLVKPIIKAGSVPWAHAIAMEAKEHIFLFLIPMAITALLIARIDRTVLKAQGLTGSSSLLVLTIAALGLAIGLLGYIISAAARWGVV